MSAPHEDTSSRRDEEAVVVAAAAPLAAEIPAKSRFLATVTRTGFVRFFSFMKSASGGEGTRLVLGSIA